MAYDEEVDKTIKECVAGTPQQPPARDKYFGEGIQNFRSMLTQRGATSEAMRESMSQPKTTTEETITKRTTHSRTTFDNDQQYGG